MNTHEIAVSILHGDPSVPQHVKSAGPVEMTKAIQAVHEFLDHITTRGGCLLLTGGVGRGKTFALYYALAWDAALRVEARIVKATSSPVDEEWRARVRAEGPPEPPAEGDTVGKVKYDLALKMYERAKDVGPVGAKTREEVEAECIRVERFRGRVIEAYDVVGLDSSLEANMEYRGILAIDDMGSEHWRDEGNEAMSSWGRSCWDRLINRRWSERLPTIISTNLGLDSIKARYGERVSDRLLDKHWTVGIGVGVGSLRGAK